MVLIEGLSRASGLFQLSLNNFHISGRYPLPAARKGPTVCAFAGGGRRVASGDLDVSHD